MKCPACESVDLLMSERQGVEIDYCPKCRGVWLDRGELDKLIERASSFDESPRGVPPPVPQQQYPQQTYRPDLDDSKHGYQYGYKKKKAWWSEIFD